jgi:hypothetical protein
MGSEVANKGFIGIGGDSSDAAKIEWWEDVDEFPPHLEKGETT